FHPRGIDTERQDRAVALSYYACAPLAFAFTPAIVLTAAMTLRAAIDPGLRIMLALVLLFVVLASYIEWQIEVGALQLVRDVRPARRSRILPACTLPVLLLACAVIGLVLIPWVIGFVALVALSFR